MSDNDHYETIHIVTMSDEAFLGLPKDSISKFKSIRSDRLDDELFKDDDSYQAFKKTYQTAKKNFEDYKFNKRHNHKTNK